jgi:hypothetical protein
VPLLLILALAVPPGGSWDGDCDSQQLARTAR